MDGLDLIARIEAAPVLPSRSSLIRHCALTAAPGPALEFGVHTGGSLRLIRGYRKPPVFGFDSFEGLPADWDVGSDAQHPVGTFACEPPQDLATGTVLVPGLFADSIPRWLDKYPELAPTLVHVDCDLYASAREVLFGLDERIQPGCVLLFDELASFDGSYPNWREGEFRALTEWLRERAREVRPIARTSHQEVAFEVLK